MLIPQPQINDAPIKTEEIAATEFNDDITMSNVTLGRNGNDISRAHATMSSGKFASLPPSCKTGGLRTNTILQLCVRSVASLPNFTLRYSTSPAQPSNESAIAL